MLISPEPWIVGVTLSLNPCVSKNRETRYPDLGPVQIFPHFKLRSTQSRDFNRWECGKKNLRHSLKMFWVSLDHAPLERSKLLVEKRVQIPTLGKRRTLWVGMNWVDL